MAGNIEIRRACGGDAVRLSDVGRRSFVQKFGGLYKSSDLEAFLREKHSVDAYEKVLADGAHAVWLAERDRAAVGYLVAGPCDLPVPDLKPNAGELMRFYLLADCQGQGVGGRLFDLGFAFLQEHFDAIYLSVYAENEGAQRFYRRRGFEKIHDYHYMVGDHPDPEWIMEWRGTRQAQ